MISHNKKGHKCLICDTSMCSQVEDPWIWGDDSDNQPHHLGIKTYFYLMTTLERLCEAFLKNM